MKILLVYGSNEGHTSKIAARVAEVLHQQGHSVDTHLLKKMPSNVLATHYEAVIVAASIHVGQYQKYVVEWVKENHSTLDKMPNAFLSTCLTANDPQPEAQAEVKGYIDIFIEQTGWQPQHVESFAGALPFEDYGWFKRRLMKLVVKQKEATANLDTTKNTVFTDWVTVDAFARHFGEIEPA